MAALLQPILLLADSQLLFWSNQGVRFLMRIRHMIEQAGNTGPLKAAYIGASNGDVVAFYELFVAAMADVGITDCRMIPSVLTNADHAFLNEAHLILLSGGRVQRGWQTFVANGLDAQIGKHYQRGALLVGISAGAVQLGLQGCAGEAGEGAPFPTFQLLPYFVDTHDEPEWLRMQRVVREQDGTVMGLGVPTGGGVFYYPDGQIEVIRYPAIRMRLLAGELHQESLAPR